MIVQPDLQDKVKVGQSTEFRGKIMKTNLIFLRGKRENSPDQIPQTDEWPIMTLEDFCPHISERVRKSLRMESSLHLNNTPLTVGLLLLNGGISYRPARKKKIKKRWYLFKTLFPMVDLADLPKKEDAALGLFNFFFLNQLFIVRKVYTNISFPKHWFH